MSTQLFLIVLTLCAAFIKKEEQLPALVYILVSFLFFFSCDGMGHNPYFYLIAMATEAFLVVCLVCLRQSYNSKIVGMLIPVSYAAVLLDFFGFLGAVKGLPADLYNEIVVAYWAVIILIFLSVGKWWDGIHVRYNSFFHHANSHNNSI